MERIQQRVGQEVRRLREDRGWTQEELAARSGRHVTYVNQIESGRRNITLQVLVELAAALDVDPATLLARRDRHPLEVEWRASWQDILNALTRGFRAQVDVRGKLAEYFLFQQLQEVERTDKAFTSLEWLDVDGKPDFIVSYAGRQITIECKNIRSREFYRRLNAYKVETQKTRNAKDGTNTRGYRIDEFDVLAACLFNHTQRWEYRFTLTRNLACRPDSPGVLKSMQALPIEVAPPWTVALAEILKDASRER